MNSQNCVICGSEKNDTSLHWRTYCEICATMTWGAPVLASFIQQLINCQDRLKEAETKLRNIDQRGS